MHYTKHCEDMLKERSIIKIWVELTVNEPEKLEDKAVGTTHYFRRIPEYGNRWLRVIVNTSEEPNKIITVFFDRRLKGK